MADDTLDSFLDACGQIGPLIVRLEGSGLQHLGPIEVRRPFLVIGRDRGADVTIDSTEVSRRHAYFQVVAGQIFCVDLASRTGVRWGDGARPLGWVDPGRGVDVGPARVRFEGVLAGAGGHLPISRSFSWPTLPEARLEFLEGETGREPWQVSRALVLLGRSPTCRLRLHGPAVGAIHAALLRTPSGVWAVDLLGPGGILVGGEPSRCARLEDGDEIGLGRHRIRVRLGPSARPSARSNLARVQVARPAPATANLPANRGVVDRGRPELAGAPDPVTARLLDEFNRMHQRTTEQFQQAILMMFRMHQDQMDVIRDELSRLDRLEDEQKSLQAELAGIHPARPPRLALRLVSGEPAPPPQERVGPRRARLDPAGAPGTPATDDPAPANQAPRAGVPPSPPPAPDPHGRLARRIAEIQDERQGLWQKLFASLTGDSPDKNVL